MTMGVKHGASGSGSGVCRGWRLGRESVSECVGRGRNGWGV